VRLECCNLRICWAELREAGSHNNTKYTITMGFDAAFEDIYMVTTSYTGCNHGNEKQPFSWMFPGQ
jgi:hypothetical protein